MTGPRDLGRRRVLAGLVATLAVLEPDRAAAARFRPMVTAERALAARINLARHRRDLASLTPGAALAEAARAHALDMGRQGYFDHAGPDGTQPWDRVVHAGGRVTALAETIAAGLETADTVVEAWLESPGHRPLLLDPTVTTIGCGVAQADRGQDPQGFGWYWVALFAR